MRRHKSHRRLINSIIVFIIIGFGVFIGAQWMTKTGFFKEPGIVRYDDSLSEVERELLSDIFSEDLTLDSDVTVSAEYRLEKPAEDATNVYIYDIYVPVTDYYSTSENIDLDKADALFTNTQQANMDYEMIPVEDLDYTEKLLSLNGSYYLDEFDKGAVYRVIKFDSNRFTDEIKPLVDEKLARSFPQKDTVLSLAQTGVTALSRGMNEKLYQVGDAKYFAEKIGDYLSGFDLTHTSNESSFTDYANEDNICSDPKFIDTLLTIGLDIVELTGNHNQDCGDGAAEETIDMYTNNNIKVVGGGKNADDAATPLHINQKGNNITFLAYNQSTGGATLDSTPGANPYDESNAVSEIKTAKERGDFVIVDIQYYECSAYASETEDATCDKADSSAGDQVGFFRHLIELGADLVVGTSAHQPQTFELYEDGVIFYGLGNLFFDQVWWPGTTRSLVLVHYLQNGKLLQTKVVPTEYDENMQTAIMENPAWYLQRLIDAKP